MSIPTGFPDQNDLAQFLVDEGILDALPSPVPDRYADIMEAVAEDFLIDIKQLMFIQEASATRTFTYRGGQLLCPPFNMFSVSAISIKDFSDVDFVALSSYDYKLQAKGKEGAYQTVRLSYDPGECEVSMTGVFGTVTAMPKRVFRALLVKGASNLLSGIEGTTTYTDGSVKRITQGPITYEFVEGYNEGAGKDANSNLLMLTYGKIVREYRKRVTY